MPNPHNQGDYEDAAREKLPVIDPERGQWTSASNAEADSLCPARHLRGLRLFDTAGPDAERGTRIHGALEIGDPSELHPDEREDYDQLLALASKALKLWNPRAEDELYDTRCEERLWITFDNGLRHSGKADRVYIDAVECRALVVDFKTGRGEVTESPCNLQLRDLACLVAVNRKAMEVTVAILQPFHAPLLTVYRPQDIVLALTEMEARVTASNDPAASAVPGERQCKWCKAKATCPEFLSACAPPVNIELPSMAKVATSIASLNGERLGQFLGLVRLASDTAEEEVRSRLGKGIAVPGWRLGEPGARETVTDPSTVHARFCDLGGATADFIGCMTLAKTKFKAAVKAATELKGTALDQRMDDLLDGCVETKPTAAKLERDKP